MLYLTCTIISNFDLAHYGVSCAKHWVFVDCGTRCVVRISQKFEKLFIFRFYFSTFLFSSTSALSGINIVVPDLEEADWSRIDSFKDQYLADIPSESVNVGPNDGSGTSSVSSSSSSTIEDDDYHNEDGAEPDPGAEGGEEEEDFEVEIRFNRYGDGGFLM